MDVRMIRAMAQGVQPRDLAACRRELADLAMVQSILASLELRVLRAMREFSTDAEGEHAQATRSSSKKSAKAKRRADAAEAIPQLDEALADGATTAEHVDVVAEVLAGLSAADRVRLAGHGDEIRVKAAQLGEGEFRRWLQMMVRRLRQDDAVARLARQKQACRASWWLDQEGMWNLRGRFDPETGARLQGRLRGATEQLAQGPLPEGAPDDPGDRRLWLQSHALAQLIDGETTVAGAASSGPEMLVVIDAETLINGEHDRTVLDLFGFDLPIDTIRRWACTSAITPVIVGLDGTRLMLGRTTRLASADQRRALAVLYRTCSCCAVPFDRCQIHHVDWWDKGGATDIDKMAPLCPRCHHLAHEGGHRLHLHADRSLTVIEPNGTVHEHAPPQVWPSRATAA
ncbi:MAG: DUF222 domain-containing protein [Actinomycetota bacterium]|nr:DUF222 domain-containing protein [Actinomycetota bacterium]